MMRIPMAAATVKPTVAKTERSMAFWLSFQRRGGPAAGPAPPACHFPTERSYSDCWLQPLKTGV